MEKPKKYYKFSLLVILLSTVLILVLALAAGYFIGRAKTLSWTNTVVNSIHPVRENNFNYKFIYPLLGYDFGNAKGFFEDKVLESKINNYIQSEYKNNNAQSISIYFRSFPGSGWAGVNQDVQYHPGSMLKVIIMMGYFRESELNQNVFNKTLLYDAATQQQANGLDFALPSSLKVGQSYKVEDLIKAMIANSDNGAETLLLNNIDRSILNDAYNDLGIKNPDSVTGDYTISASQYTSFLRILYNSTYLEDQDSEEALNIMSQSTYKDGLSAGVPSGITVAQKYGERVDGADKDIQAVELHDCGIIYSPNPYALCVMTKGTDVAKLTDAIKNISAITYGYVTSH
jgi:beta-lactamase class A